ncbi:PepSY domain-containing protein [Sphingomonas sp. 22176]|uniref:PepSY domain-containing protein n=1 Tax=Sphingomonas sp. 22176 TaxID=3453884 RepID=UPI003F82C56D
MITAAEAMDAALRFARPPYDEANVVQVDAEPARIGDVSVWKVKVEEVPVGPDAWMEIHWAPVFYFVDAENGRVIGFATERGTTMLR